MEIINKSKIACIQCEIKPTFSEAISEADDLCVSAVSDGAQFLFLPEYCGGLRSKGGAFVPPVDREEEHPFLIHFKKFARQKNVWIMIGSIAIAGINGKFFNRGFVINNLGQIVSRYNKINLFDVRLNASNFYHESATVMRGNSGCMVKTPIGDVGHTICYDLRFPILYRKLAQKGAKILAIPSAFTAKTGEAHWHVLNRARAIETTSYVVSPCAMGKIEGGGSSYGHSLIIDPWGKVLADAGSERGYITGVIDISLVDEVRSKITSLFNDNTFDLVSVSVNESVAL